MNVEAVSFLCKFLLDCHELDARLQMLPGNKLWLLWKVPYRLIIFTDCTKMLAFPGDTNWQDRNCLVSSKGHGNEATGPVTHLLNPWINIVSLSALPTWVASYFTLWDGLVHRMARHETLATKKYCEISCNMSHGRSFIKFQETVWSSGWFCLWALLLPLIPSSWQIHRWLD